MKNAMKFCRTSDVLARAGLDCTLSEGEFVRGVLEELGILKNEGGICSVDPSVKSDLANSAIYRAAVAAIGETGR